MGDGTEEPIAMKEPRLDEIERRLRVSLLLLRKRASNYAPRAEEVDKRSRTTS